jgi:enediyne biosynthesis protein CalE5
MPDGKVVATDISPKILAIAKTRAKSLGLDAIMEFRESDGEKLDLLEPRARFDAILSRWGLMFLPNLDSALARTREILVTDGSLSVTVWSAPSKVPLLDLAFATVRKQMDAPAPQPATPGPFALADIETLKKSFIQAGFKDIRIDMFQITFDFDSPESYTRFHQQITAPLHAMLANHSEEVKKRAWDSITEVIWQYADSHGRVNLDNEVICIVGRN